MNQLPQAEDWSPAHFQKLVEYFEQKRWDKYMVHEPRPAGTMRDKLWKLGQLYGYKEMQLAVDKYFQWCDDNIEVPCWEVFIRNASKKIMKTQSVRNKKARHKQVRKQEESSRQIDRQLNVEPGENVTDVGEFFANIKKNIKEKGNESE